MRTPMGPRPVRRSALVEVSALARFFALATFKPMNARNMPSFFDVAITVSLLASIALVDWLTGAELTLSSVYLLPVGFAAWRIGLSASVTTSLASALVTLYVDMLSQVAFSSPFFLYWSALIRLSFFLFASIVLVRLRRAQAKLDEVARVDDLTGLANYRAFAEECSREIVRHRRSGRPLSLANIDLDGFKSLNDSRGHAAGDTALAQVGEVLRAGRASDLAARVGGDEFVVLMPDTPVDAARAAMVRLHARLCDEMKCADIPVTFSIGVASFDEEIPSMSEMLKEADEAMYTVKRSSKNAVCCVSPAPRSRGPKRTADALR